MMYSEFLYLADASEREVSAREYTAYIESLYMDDPEELDKFRWCARYAKGLIAMLPALRKLEKRNSELEERIADMDKSAEENWSAYQNVLKGRTEARQKVGELSDKLESIKAILADKV